MPSNTTVIIVGVLFYHGYMFRRLIGLSSGYSGGLHCYYQSIYIFTITVTLEAHVLIINAQRTMICTNVKASVHNALFSSVMGSHLQS
jgi:hypothetical protein